MPKLWTYLGLLAMILSSCREETATLEARMRLELGQTKPEVEESHGAPSQVIPQGEGHRCSGDETWLYVYEKNERLLVCFDENDRVRETSIEYYYPD